MSFEVFSSPAHCVILWLCEALVPEPTSPVGCRAAIPSAVPSSPGKRGASAALTGAEMKRDGGQNVQHSEPGSASPLAGGLGAVQLFPVGVLPEPHRQRLQPRTI